MNAWLALFFKELRLLLRDPFLLIAIVWFFTAEVYIAATGMKLTLNNAPIAVLDEAHNQASRDWTQSFQPPWFRSATPPANMEAAQERLRRQQLMLAADIPPRFRPRDTHEQEAMQLLIDGANVTLASLAVNDASLIHARYNQQQLRARLHLPASKALPVPLIDVQTRLLYNQANLDRWFMGVTELFLIITLMGMLLTAALAVREKETGTFEQLAVVPLTPGQILTAKVAAVTLMILLGGALSLGVVLHGVVGVPIRGEPLTFLILLTLYSFAVCGLGLVIATLTRNLGQVMLVSFMLLLPMMLLSGAWVPPESMPQWEQKLMALTPLYHFNIIGQSLIFKGAGWQDLWPHISALAALSAILFAFGTWRFRAHLIANG